jgi:hypothetical protein
MFKIKLLTSLYKYFICISMLLLSACNYYYLENEYRQTFYVSPTSSLGGMQLRNNLLVFFPNQDIKTTEYNIQTTLKITESLFLTNMQGYATQGKVDILVTCTIINMNDKSVLAVMNIPYSNNYNVEISAHSNKIALTNAVDSLTKVIAKDIYMRVSMLMAKKS